MFRYNFLSALKKLFRHRQYSYINIGGLAFGLAACWLILLFVRSEIGYDRWIPGSEQIYRLHSVAYIPGRDAMRSTRTSGQMFRALKSNFEEIEYSTRLFYSNPRVFHDGNVFNQSVTLVDRDFFNVFDLPLLQGDRNSALSDYQSIIVSESTARRFFGTVSPLGKKLSLCCYGSDDKNIDYVVTGVMADTREDTHFYLDAIALIDENRYLNSPNLFDSWTSMNNNTYVKFVAGKNAESIGDRLVWFMDNIFPDMSELLSDPNIKTSDIFKLSLMPITDIHLNARDAASDTGDIRPLGNRTLVVSFLLIAVLVLGIATINFLNLTTAKFATRAREVSMRKVLGASQREVAVQFLSETIITSLLALLVSVFLVILLLPWFNQILSTDLQLNLFSSGSNLLTLLSITLLAGLIAGSYPSFYISRLKPARVFNGGRSSDGSQRGIFKNILVVFQFSISIALITVTVVTWTQTDYVRSADLGYQHDNRIVVTGLSRPGAREFRQNLLAKLRELPTILQLAQSSEVPTSSRENNTQFTVSGHEQDVGKPILNYISADTNYFDIYGIEALAGRVFSEEFPADMLGTDIADGQISGSIILNESAARRLTFSNPADAIGEVVTTATFGGVTSFSVIGVVPDVNNRSALFESIPSVYWMRERSLDRLTILHDGSDIPMLIDRIEEAWRSLIPTVPFNYSLLDEMVQQLYLDEERQVMTFSAFSLLAIIISGLGLYAMASFTIVRRTREIGLRKVLGARVFQIVRQLLWQFSKPVVIANLIAWPLAWYFLSDWLNGFVYRIDLNPAYFILAGMAALVIAWSTVAYHAWRVAQSNPIHALRHE